MNTMFCTPSRCAVLQHVGELELASERRCGFALRAANPCAQIGETVAFGDAIQAGMAYQAKHPDTLVIVTADHSHTSQVIPQTTTSPGKTSTLIGADAAPSQTDCPVPDDDRASSAPGCITVNYATSTGRSQTHTGHTVRVGAIGPQAANVLGLIDQTDLFKLMRRTRAGGGA